MKVVEFFLMSGMGKSVSRWGVHVGMSSLLVLCSSCCSTRTIHVVDGDGVPVPQALVIFREFNISPLWSRTGAGFADQFGDYKFKAHNQVRVEVFGVSSKWGELFLSDNAAGTIVLSSVPYNGDVANWYLCRTPTVPEEIRSRLRAFPTDMD